ncbi:NAD(P)-dependent oxidoreductase [Nocardiopsis sp. CC223A]|uniref:NAD(P)-dependent oxidoreductase n=1 Tax=Nocardiopsis sp. CC223A TaxID=3044051 RepID=UPI00278C50EE|nr:NAD(P)-dependent oxidoreductase [Nocardiopsis sp. CC223A]
MPPRTIGFPRETGPGERRTLLTPHLARTLTDAGYRVLAEPGLGAGIDRPDRDLEAVGVKFTDQAQVWAAPLVLRYKPGPHQDLRRLAPGQSIGAIFHAEGDPRMLTALTATGVSAYSYEFWHEHDRFPLAAAGGRIAGALAVHEGARALRHPRGRGILLDHTPGAPPTRVLVIGNGNVGHAAAVTATALGAHVTILTRTPGTADAYAGRTPAGAVVAANTPDRLAAELAKADLVIGALLISTHTTPAMIDLPHLATMRPGAVIVDATCGYGPGYLPTAGPVQDPGDDPLIVEGVLHVKLDALPRLVPHTASHAYAHAAAPYLLRLAGHALDGAPDQGAHSALIAQGGMLAHPVVREHADLYRTGRAA